MHANVSPQVLKSFGYSEGQVIRTFGTPTEPLFAAADVCKAVGIKNHRDALASLADDEKGVVLTDTPGGQQKITLLTESGLYTLILRCRSAVTPGTPAFKFRRWITTEVLPAIRRHGAYRAELDRDAARVRNRVTAVQRNVIYVLEDLTIHGVTPHAAAQIVGNIFHGAVAAAISYPAATPSNS